MMHEETLLQFRSLTTSARASAADENFWLLSTLLGIGNGNSPDKRVFTHKLLENLIKVPRYEDFRRISIVRRLGYSNQLQVICVTDIGKEPANMKPGYSCFVDPKGSLFSLRPDSIRSYKSPKAVVDSFIKKNKEPQRSIYRISQSSSFAGYCIGLFLKNNLEGFFFANRSGEDTFTQNPADYALFSCLALLSTNYLLQLPSTSRFYRLNAQQNLESYIGRHLDLDYLTHLITEYLKIFSGDHLISSLSLAKNNEINQTLISHGNLAQTMARCIFASKFRAQGVLEVKKIGHSLVFSINGTLSEINPFYTEILAEINQDASVLGQKIEITNNKISVSCPYDGISTELYSIENVL